MQYNSHADNQDIVSLIVDATGLNATAHIKQITRATNEANRIIWSWIFDAYGGWQYDDGNHSNLPTATAALVASQQKYTLPSEAITVRSVAVKDQSGFWRNLEPITLEEIATRQAENEFHSTTGNPLYYRPVNGLIFLYPAPNYAQAASLQVEFDRGSVQFASTDTTKTPGFASEFHGAVASGASYFIAKNKNHKNTGRLERDWFRYEERIKSFYKARFAELNPQQPTNEFIDPIAEVV